MTSATETNDWKLRRGALVYPQPVAMACGRVLRARTASERVDACLKAGEVLARFLAAISLTSFAARDDRGEHKLAELKGDLAFGQFLGLVQEVAASKLEHPAAPLLAQGFKRIGKGKRATRGLTDAALVEILELRNDLGHELRNLDHAKAVLLESSDPSPRDLLAKALDGVDALLAKPLFIVEAQEWEGDCLDARRLLLMGESADPHPESIKLKKDSGVSQKGVPYVAIGDTCLPLPPSVLWDVDPTQQCYALFFLDAVNEEDARYCTLGGTKQDRNGSTVQVLRGMHNGQVIPAELVLLSDDRNFASEWADLRNQRVDAGLKNEGLVDWNRMDGATLDWYAGLLGGEEENSHELIRKRLLDGRSHLEPSEFRQLKLLFGVGADVRAELGRDVLDLRLLDEDSRRPSERELVESENLLTALQKAVRFLAAHSGMGEVEAEDLQKMEGTVDYLTLREVLVNLIVHQDYTDTSAAGQIELRTEGVMVFNAGVLSG